MTKVKSREIGQALKEITADQALQKIQHERVRKHISKECEAEQRLRVAVWIGHYLESNPLPPLRPRKSLQQLGTGTDVS